MSGNVFGDLYRITTFGESHGKLIGVVIDGCPAGLELDLDKIQYELDRRKPGQTIVASQRKEEDKLIINTGLYEGRTTGAPIEMVVMNKDADSSKYNNISDKFRPGHADYTFFAKYGFRDPRGGGRSSARETAARVMAGAVAKQILKKYEGIEVYGATVCLGGIEAIKRDYVYAETNMLKCPDPAVYDLMATRAEDAKRNNDSVGGAVEVIARNVPVGLGEPVFDKLNAVLMHALASIGAVKAIELGLGRKVEGMLGSEYQDQKEWNGTNMNYHTNNAGGIEGGISNGQDIAARLSIKPTPTRTGVKMVLPTEDYMNKEVEITGRHDPIIMPRLVPVAESMMAITLVDFLLKQKSYEFYRK